MLICKNSNVEGDRPSTNKLQKFIAKYEVYVRCTRDVGETGEKGTLNQILYLMYAF